MGTLKLEVLDREVVAVWNDDLKEKFSDPYYCGAKQQLLLKKLAVFALNVVRDDLSCFDPESHYVVRILEGGKYYFVPEAYREAFGREVAVGDIKIRSRFKYSKEDVVAEVVDRSRMALPRREELLVIVGDTVASGKTMVTLLEHLKGEVERFKLVLLAIATLKGVERIRAWCSKHGVELKVVAYGGLLGLGPNKTDMTLGYPPNRIPEEVKRYAVSVNGEEIAEKLCVIGDFTDSNANLASYYAERLVQLWEIGVESESEQTKQRCKQLIARGYRLLSNVANDEEVEALIAEQHRRRLKLLGIEDNVKSPSLKHILELKDVDTVGR